MTSAPTVARRNPWPWIGGGLLGALLGPLVVFRVLGAGSVPLEVLVLVVAAGAWWWLFRSRRAVALGALAGTVVGCAAWFGAALWFLGGLKDGGARDDYTPQTLGTQVGLKLPSGATSIQGYEQGFMDVLLHARFEMPRAELAAFLRNNRLEEDTSANAGLKNASLSQPWWTPEAGRRAGIYRPKPSATGGEGVTKTGYFLTVQVNELEGGRVLVYIYAFTT